MSKYIQQTEIVKCDFPGCVETDETPTGRPFETIVINGKEWDICRDCYRAARRVITFLSVTVGLDLRLGEDGKQTVDTLRY